MFHFFISFVLLVLTAMAQVLPGSDNLTPTGIASLLIDQDPELSRMAEQSSQLYRLCMDCGSDSFANEMLYKSQYEWTRHLSQCASAECLAAGYRRKTKHLREHLRWASEAERGRYDNVENLLSCKRGW